MNAWVFAAIGVVFAAVTIAAVRYWHLPFRRTMAIGLIVTGAIYPVFAIVFGARGDQLMIELGGAVLFGAFAWAGLVHSMRWLIAGWVLHTLWDMGLHAIEPASGFVPAAYPYICLTFDLTVAAALWRYRRESLKT